MANLLTSRAEMSALVKRFHSYGNDSMAYSRDHFEKNKREECCELQGGRLNFFESVKPDHNTTTTVVEVEKRRGTNILILRCGPGGRTVIFLEFDSKRITDEWQEALCQYTGQTHVPNPALRRVRSELPGVVSVGRRDKTTRSTFPDIVVEQVDSDSEVVVCSETPEGEAPLEHHQEASPIAHSETPKQAPLEAPPAPPLAHPEGPSAPPARPLAPHSPPGSPSEERVPIFTSETSETDSCPDSLRSIDADLNPTLADLVKHKFTRSYLEQLKFMDFTGNDIVKEESPLCQLHVGDKIEMRNVRGPEMTARELIEHIRTSIVLTLARGVVCTARQEENELVINIKGSQTVRLDTVEVILRACTSPCFIPYAEMPERSNLAITEINNIPVVIGSQPNQIAESMTEALETSGGKLTLHLVPQSLLDAMAEEDDGTHE